MGQAGNANGDNYVEATLDIQYLSSMAPKMQSACVNTDNSTNAEGSTGKYIFINVLLERLIFILFIKDLVQLSSHLLNKLMQIAIHQMLFP